MTGSETEWQIDNMPAGSAACQPSLVVMMVAVDGFVSPLWVLALVFTSSLMRLRFLNMGHFERAQVGPPAVPWPPARLLSHVGAA